MDENKMDGSSGAQKDYSAEDKKMQDRLRTFVYDIFRNEPMTAKAVDVRDEICANVLERYADLRLAGATPEEAYDIAAKSVGNASAILDSLRTQSPVRSNEQIRQSETLVRKTSQLTAFGVFLIIGAVGVLIAFGVAGHGDWGAAAMMVMIGIGVAVLVYSASLKKGNEDLLMPRGLTPEEEEDFREWRQERVEGRRRTNRYSAVLWPLIAAIYFLVSFMTGAWYITWVIFIIGAAVEKLIEILADDKARK